MTVHEMLQQVALLSQADYSRSEEVSSIEFQLGNNRHQRIYGKTDTIAGEKVGLLYTKVGSLNETIDPTELLAMNTTLRYARVALYEDDIVLLALFDLMNTSVKECAPMLAELAATADELEQRFFTSDMH